MRNHYPHNLRHFAMKRRRKPASPSRQAWLPPKQPAAFANDIEFLSYANAYRRSLLDLVQQTNRNQIQAEHILTRALIKGCKQKHQLQSRSDFLPWLRKIVLTMV